MNFIRINVKCKKKKGKRLFAGYSSTVFLHPWDYIWEYIMKRKVDGADSSALTSVTWHALNTAGGEYNKDVIEKKRRLVVQEKLWKHHYYLWVFFVAAMKVRDKSFCAILVSERLETQIMTNSGYSFSLNWRPASQQITLKSDESLYRYPASWFWVSSSGTLLQEVQVCIWHGKHMVTAKFEWRYYNFFLVQNKISWADGHMVYTTSALLWLLVRIRWPGFYFYYQMSMKVAMTGHLFWPRKDRQREPTSFDLY